MNRAVHGDSEVGGFAIIVRTVSTNQVKVNELKVIDENDVQTALENNRVSFSISNSDGKFIKGQYYKVQIAYTDKTSNKNIGHYSTAAIVKCTGEASAVITNDLTQNKNVYSYTGRYENTDINEKVHYYEFNIYDSKSNLYATSGKLIHNSLGDEVTSSQITATDGWILEKSLIENTEYTIQYKVYTVNDLELASPTYTIQDSYAPVPGDFNIELSASMNLDDGFIELSMHSNDNSSLNGNYILSRSSSEDDFSIWHTLHTFRLAQNKSGLIIYQDFTTKQGVEYLYSIQLYNTSKRSERILNREHTILADFEDMFLYDGERQLKIKFNPQVSSFKTTILESKTDTLGGKYPFFFRNGNVGYKEFSISGLLSILSDENNYFTQNNNEAMEYRTVTKAGLSHISDTNKMSVTAENFETERTFKLKVLDWLNNGQPKLFRSPGEGNYVIRLMNVSLSPNATLGRMLHTFSSTAYEIADMSFESLKELKFLPSSTDVTNYGIVNKTINLNDIDIEPLIKDGTKITLPNSSKEIVLCTLPRSKVAYSGRNNTMPMSGIQIIPDGVNEISFASDRNLRLSTISFTYENTQLSTDFDKQISEKVDILTENNIMINDSKLTNLMSRWNTTEGNVTCISKEFFFIEMQRRPQQLIIIKNGRYLSYENQKGIALNASTLYIVVKDEDKLGRDGQIFTQNDQGNGIIIVDDIDCTCIIKTNENIYDYTQLLTQDDEMFSLYNPGVITSFVCGNGVKINVGYRCIKLTEEA